MLLWSNFLGYRLLPASLRFARHSPDLLRDRTWSLVGPVLTRGPPSRFAGEGDAFLALKMSNSPMFFFAINWTYRRPPAPMASAVRSTPTGQRNR